MLTPDELERYKRNLLLPGAGEEGQLRLKRSRVLVVGAGGIGSPLLLYLAAAGVGNLGILDGDAVDLSNLQRQILYRESDPGKPKAGLAARSLQQLNSTANIYWRQGRFEEKDLSDLMEGKPDFLVDASDNFATKFQLNDMAHKHNIPFLLGSVIEWDGHVFYRNPEDGGCYRCLFGGIPSESDVPPAATRGISGAFAGTVGSLLASFLIRLILRVETPSSSLVTLRGNEFSMRRTAVPVRKSCPLCGQIHKS